MRVIVCGGRDYGLDPIERAHINGCLDDFHGQHPITFLWHGNAAGVDRIAGTWGQLHNVRVTAVPAEWAKHGKRAGPIRNQNMLGQGIHAVIAFPGGRGTADMVHRAEKAGVPVHRYP